MTNIDTPTPALHRPRAAHRPETLGPHATTVQEIRGRAAIADMRRLCDYDRTGSQ